MEIQTFLALIVLGMGTARLTALLVHDEITASLRDMIWHWSPPHDDEDKGHLYQWLREATPDERNALHHVNTDLPWWTYHFHGAEEQRPPGFWGRVIDCPLCASVWIAGLNVLAYLLVPAIALGLNAWMMVSLLGVTQMGRWWR
jgi:hypothetical protein